MTLSHMPSEQALYPNNVLSNVFSNVLSRDFVGDVPAVSLQRQRERFTGCKLTKFVGLNRFGAYRFKNRPFYSYGWKRG